MGEALISRRGGGSGKMAIVKASRTSARVITIPELIGCKYAFILANGDADADYAYFVIKDGVATKVIYYVGTSHATRNSIDVVTYNASTGTITTSSAVSNDGLDSKYTAYIFY